MMLQKTLITIVILFQVLLHSGIALAWFADSDMVGVHDIALQIYDACPPSDCFVIGLGRSPTPFVADLSMAAKDYVWNVPLSQFQYNDPDGKISKEQLSEAERSKLFAHLKTFLPPSQLTRGKRLLVIDYAHTGANLLSAQRYFQDYLDNADPSSKNRTKVESAAIAAPLDQFSNLTQNRPNFIFNIPAKEHELTYKMFNQLFDEESEYGSFSLERSMGPSGSVPKERKSSKAYLKLVAKIRKLRAELKLKPFSDDHRPESVAVREDSNALKKFLKRFQSFWKSSALEAKTEKVSSPSISVQTYSSLENKVATTLGVVRAATDPAYSTYCNLGNYNGFKTKDENFGGNECFRALRDVENGKLDTLKDFISDDNRVQICFMNAAKRGFTPLVEFIAEKRPELIRKLLFLTNTEGYTPIVEAAVENKIETFKFLLQLGVKFAPSSLVFLPKGSDQSETLATWIVKRPADHKVEILKIIANEYPDLLFIRNAAVGLTPAHVAIRQKNFTALKAILDNGPKELVNVKDFTGATLLHTAELWKSRPDVIKYLEAVKAR